MKKLLLVMLASVMIGSLGFAEGMAKAGKLGLQTAITFTNATGSSAGDIGVKYIITDEIALRAAIGLLHYSGSGSSQTLFDIGAGFEYHFRALGGVSPYAGAALSYSGESLSSGGSTPSDIGISALGGAEYFFSSNFSWAGEARIGFGSYNSGSSTTTRIGTLGMYTFIMTWYLTP
jgi:hypothetical protein